MITSPALAAPLNFIGALGLIAPGPSGFAEALERLLIPSSPDATELVETDLPDPLAQAFSDSDPETSPEPAASLKPKVKTAGKSSPPVAAVPLLDILRQSQPAPVARIVEQAVAATPAKELEPVRPLEESGRPDAEESPEPVSEETFLDWAAQLMPPPAMIPPPVVQAKEPRSFGMPEPIAAKEPPVRANVTWSGEPGDDGETEDRVQRPLTEVPRSLPVSEPVAGGQNAVRLPVQQLPPGFEAPPLLEVFELEPSDRAPLPRLVPVETETLRAAPPLPRQAAVTGREELDTVAVEVQLAMPEAVSEETPEVAVRRREPAPVSAPARPASKNIEPMPRHTPAIAETAAPALRTAGPSEAPLPRRAPAPIQPVAAASDAGSEAPASPAPDQQKSGDPWSAKQAEPVTHTAPPAPLVARAEPAAAPLFRVQSQPDAGASPEPGVREPERIERPSPPPAAPPRQIVIDLKDSTGEDLRMAVRDRGANVQISLHSSDGALREAIRSGVSELAGNLELAGYQVDGMTIERTRESTMQWTGGQSDSPDSGPEPERQNSPRNRDQQPPPGADAGNGSSRGRGRRDWKRSIEEELWQTL